LGGNWLVTLLPDARERLLDLLGLSMANYAFDAVMLPKESLTVLLGELKNKPLQTVNELLATAGMATASGVRALLWLWKFDLVRIRVVQEGILSAQKP
jgi:hypothetical protein